MRSTLSNVAKLSAKAARSKLVQNIEPVLSVDDADLTRIVGLAASLFGTENAGLGLVGEHAPNFGIASGEALDEAFVAETLIPQAEHLGDASARVVTDSNGRESLMGGQDGTTPPFLAFAPVTISEQTIGVLYVFDTKEREAPAVELADQLGRLADTAAALIDLKASAASSRRSALARRRAEFRHSLAMRIANIGSFVWDLRADRIEFDNVMHELLDLEASEAPTGSDLFSEIFEEDVERVQDALDAAMTGSGDYRVEFRTRTGNRWLLGVGRVYERDSDGVALSLIGVNVEITSTKTSEQTTRLLLRELNHRVKNTLAMLQSLAAQTLRRTQSPAEFMTAFSGRLQALSAAHTLLSDREWGNLEVQTLLKSLIGPYALNFDQAVTIEGPDVSIGPDEGVGLGLVVHELATNAVRHGSLSVREGKLRITTDTDRDASGKSRLVIGWEEIGGPPVEAPVTSGFGSVLIQRGLQKVVGSTVDVAYAPEGLRATIRVPISRRNGT